MCIYLGLFWPVRSIYGTCTYLGLIRGMCTNHRVIYMLTLHARTNIPLSSARPPTSFQRPHSKSIVKADYILVADMFY